MLTRLLVERGEQGGVQAIPPTLQQSLAARLDRLGAAREVAQIGAVLRRDFVYARLRDLAEIDESALQASLNRLADADLLFVEGASLDHSWRRIELKLSMRCSLRSPPLATERVMADSPAHRPKERPTGRLQ